MKRVQLQTIIWKSALKLHPPSVDPTNYGYVKEGQTKPSTVSVNVPLAPEACTIFCVCKASVTCFNGHTNDDDVRPLE